MKTREWIDGLEKRYRANLINSITGYKPANLVGTCDPEGHTNLALFSSAVHLGANPPLIGLISRPDSVPRHTLENIRATRQYTLNAVTENLITPAHQTSARYERSVSEFETAGLTIQFETNYSAPFVKEAPLRIGLSLVEIIPIKYNGTYMIIGEIVLLDLPATAIQEDGFVNLQQLHLVAINGLDGYVSPSKKALRLPYAKP